jgi:hypothetical protein
VTQAYEAALQPAADAQEQARALHDLVAAMEENAGQVIVVHPQWVFGLQGDVTGFEFYLSGIPEFRGVGIAG